MAGLNLMGSVKASAGNGYSSSQSPSTATEAAYGPGYSQTGSPSTTSALMPNDPFGAAFWSGIIALALLGLIRHSLPQ